MIFTAFKHTYPLHATAKNKSPTDLVILDAILMSRADWNDICLCMYICEKGDNEKTEKIHENNA